MSVLSFTGGRRSFSCLSMTVQITAAETQSPSGTRSFPTANGSICCSPLCSWASPFAHFQPSVATAPFGTCKHWSAGQCAKSQPAIVPRYSLYCLSTTAALVGNVQWGPLQMLHTVHKGWPSKGVDYCELANTWPVVVLICPQLPSIDYTDIATGKGHQQGDSD